jgi:anti-anti-sigma regulatory factor
MPKRNDTKREIAPQLAGVFDVRAAWKVEGILERARPSDVITLDFSRVREFHDFGVAVLAQALKQRGCARVGLKGLRGNELRILREFGVNLRAFRLPTVAAPGPA